MSESPISVADGKIRVRTSYSIRPRIEPECMDEFLKPESISRVAAKLWDGDNEASVSNALTLIEGCARELALRRSPLAGITLSGNQSSASSRRNSSFWKHCSLELVIEIAATVSRSRQSDDAVKQAFSIIESAMTMREKRSEGNVG